MNIKESEKEFEAIYCVIKSIVKAIKALSNSVISLQKELAQKQDIVDVNDIKEVKLINEN